MTGHHAGSLAKSKLLIPNAAANLQRSSILRLFPPSNPWLATPCFRRPVCTCAGDCDAEGCATGAACGTTESALNERADATPSPTELKKFLRSITSLAS